MPAQAAAVKPRLAVMNAVHDLPVLVARDKGYFRDEGLDIEFVTTPGMAQAGTSTASASPRGLFLRVDGAGNRIRTATEVT